MYYRGAQAAIIVYDITSQVLHAEIAASELLLMLPPPLPPQLVNHSEI